VKKYLKPLTTKRKFACSLLVGVAFLLISSAPIYAKTFSSPELIENANGHDGETITFRGEVIGDVMIREDHAWIHLNDDPYAKEPSKLAGYNSGMAIWCKTEDVKLIKYVGDYKNRGDIVEITGCFNGACPEHGGDMDIHATHLKIIELGYPFEHELQMSKFWWALVLGFISGTLFLANKYWYHR